MKKSIDIVKLKECAEHLEWSLIQYPHIAEVQGLLRSMRPLIDQAKNEKVTEPLERQNIPSRYDLAEGAFIPYKDPNIDKAYVSFLTELTGGLTEQDKLRIARMEAMREANKKEVTPCLIQI